MKTVKLDVATPPKVNGFSTYRLYYPDDLVAGDVVRVVETDPLANCDRSFLQRLSQNYARQHERHKQEASGVWATISREKKDVHKAAQAGDLDRLFEFLRYPAKSMIMHGFDQPTKVSLERQLNPGTLRIYRTLVLGSLRRMGEAIGAIRMVYPEGFGLKADVVSNGPMTCDEMLDAIEAELGRRIVFPCPFVDDMGILSKRGVLSYRAVQALFQAWRLSTVLPGATSALEIGGGTGRTAAFAAMFGTPDYTIVDLPLTGLVQAYYVAMALGPDRVCLETEPERREAVKIISPPGLRDREFDVVASFDALVEFSEEAARRYILFARSNARCLLSVNRESKSYSVRGLLKEINVPAARNPYWLRRGYVEEVARFDS